MGIRAGDVPDGSAAVPVVLGVVGGVHGPWTARMACGATPRRPQHHRVRQWLLSQVLPAPPPSCRPRRSVEVVDNRAEVRQFLCSRRARLQPEQAGLPAYGGNRRVPGLRPEEAAMLAGLSVDDYVQLERGNLKGVSESALDAVANALQLCSARRTATMSS